LRIIIIFYINRKENEKYNKNLKKLISFEFIPT